MFDNKYGRKASRIVFFSSPEAFEHKRCGAQPLSAIDAGANTKSSFLHPDIIRLKYHLQPRLRNVTTPPGAGVGGYYFFILGSRLQFLIGLVSAAEGGKRFLFSSSWLSVREKKGEGAESPPLPK